ncbi:hypothetical protein TRAPUB_6801 [Trametes pubescens]|uniref:Uncharacterized protein n=1 Tax=Trametes pubescens TaxID=154538 RepID=A0A1M2W725_TRAPU|nr:hypothetical protein TRAPUB_6801 [Trametes pubescens]
MSTSPNNHDLDSEIEATVEKGPSSQLTDESPKNSQPDPQPSMNAAAQPASQRRSKDSEEQSLESS